MHPSRHWRRCLPLSRLVQGGSFNKSELATMDRLLPAGMGASPLGQRLALLDLSANSELPAPRLASLPCLQIVGC